MKKNFFLLDLWDNNPERYIRRNPEDYFIRESSTEQKTKPLSHPKLLKKLKNDSLTKKFPTLLDLNNGGNNDLVRNLYKIQTFYNKKEKRIKDMKKQDYYKLSFGALNWFNEVFNKYTGTPQIEQTNIVSS